MKTPKGWRFSMKQNDAKMIEFEVKMTKLAYFKLLLKTAWGFDIRPLWIKPAAVLWVSAKLWIKGLHK